MYPSPREIIAECALILGVVIGAWLLFIENRASELTDLETRIEQTRSQPTDSIEAVITRFADQMEGMRRRVEVIRTMSRFGIDSYILYDAMMRCARDHDITVERLNPLERKDDEAGESGVSAIRFSASVRGRFRDIIGFVEALQQINGFVRPVSVRLAPSQAVRDECNGQIDCELLSFAVPRTLVAALSEKGNDGE